MPEKKKGPAAAAGLKIISGGQSPAGEGTFADAERLAESIKAFSLASKAQSTRRAYHSDWRHFAEWCERSNRAPLPATAETVTMYLVAHAHALKAATLSRRLVAISRVHRAEGHDSPTRQEVVRTVFAGIRRQIGTAPQGKAPILVEDLKEMVKNTPPTVQGTRDRALLLIGFGGAFRRAEIAGLDVGDIVVTSAGLVVTLRRSKTDQEGRGRRIGVPHSKECDRGEGICSALCPVAAHRDWLQTLGKAKGPLFVGIDRHERILFGKRLTGHAVAYIIKRAVTRVGLDPAIFAGHSLRAGLATSAAVAGASEGEIMRQTGHKSEAMVRRYIRDADVWRQNAATTAGL